MNPRHQTPALFPPRPAADDSCSLTRRLARGGRLLELWSCSAPAPRTDLPPLPPRIPIHEHLVRAGGLVWWVVDVNVIDLMDRFPSPELRSEGWYVGPVPSTLDEPVEGLTGPHKSASAAASWLQAVFPEDHEAGQRIPPGEPKEGYRGDPRSRRQQDALDAKRATLIARGATWIAQGLTMEEVRGARGLPPGPYWALYFHDRCHDARSWIELTRMRPPGSRTWRQVREPTLPDGRRYWRLDILTLCADGTVRLATDEERRAAGELQALPAPSERRPRPRTGREAG